MSKKNNLLSASIIVAALIISGTVFFAGMSLSSDLANLTSAVSKLNLTTTTTGAQDTQAQPQEPQQDFLTQEEVIEALLEGNPAQCVSNPRFQGDPLYYGPCSIETTVGVDDDAVKGNQNAEIQVIEFSDFQCPFCKRFFDATLPSVLENYSEDIAFVFRDFPLSSIHPFAQKASEAAECAKVQEKFWEYHDKLFENQTNLTVTDLKQYAVDLGLDSEQFNECLDSDTFKEEVENDLDEGTEIGIGGTPAFLIKNADYSIRIIGAHPFSTFQKTIDALLG